jgi:hypothetical protein
MWIRVWQMGASRMLWLVKDFLMEWVGLLSSCNIHEPDFLCQAISIDLYFLGAPEPCCLSVTENVLTDINDWFVSVWWRWMFCVCGLSAIEILPFKLHNRSMLYVAAFLLQAQAEAFPRFPWPFFYVLHRTLMSRVSCGSLSEGLHTEPCFTHTDIM